MDTRIRHVAGDPRFVAEPERVREQLTEYTDCCIAGLFASRSRHEEIDIHLTPTPNFDRVEICDAAAYLTLFSTRGDERRPYPQTLRLSPDSTFYAMMQRDTQRATGAPGAVVLRLRAHTTEAEVLDFYGDVLQRPISLEELAEMTARFRKYEAEFSRKVRLAVARAR